MEIEVLEPRIVLAGVVELFLTPKLLTVKDLVGADSTLQITAASSGEITITPDATTALKLQGSILADGQPLTLPFFAGGIKAALGGGADALTVSGFFVGGVKVDLGAGDNAFTLKDASVSGGVVIKGGAARDNLGLEGNVIVAGDISANLGNGENSLSGGATKLTVGRNLTVQGGTGDNNLNLNIAELNVRGNLRFTGNGTSNYLNLLTFGGLKIGGSVNFAATSGDATVLGLFASADMFVGGSVAMKSVDAGHVNAGLGSFTGSTHVNGSVSFNTGKLARTNPLNIVGGETLFIGKALTIQTSPNMRPEIQGGSVNGPSFIGGPVTIKGANVASIAMDGTIAGKLSVSIVGSDGRTMALTSATAEGTLRLLSAATLASTGSTGGGITRLDNIFAESSLTIKDAGGTRTVEIQDALIAGPLTIDTGTGVDTVTLRSSGERGNLCLLGALKILTGAGLDIITLGGTDPNTGVSTRGTAILIDGGPDLAEFSVGGASLLDGLPVLKNLLQ